MFICNNVNDEVGEAEIANETDEMAISQPLKQLSIEMVTVRQLL